MPKIITSHAVLEPLKQVLSAARDVIISGQICGSKLQRVFTLGDGYWLPHYPPAQNQYMQEKFLRGIHFSANTCGACIRTRANTGKYFRGVIFCILAKFLREILSGRKHVARVFAPARIQENTPGELVMYREGLHGVGADGVGVKFPFFAINFAVVCPCPLGEEEKSKEKRRKVKKNEKCVKKTKNA